MRDLVVLCLTERTAIAVLERKGSPELYMWEASMLDCSPNVTGVADVGIGSFTCDSGSGVETETGSRAKCQLPLITKADRAAGGCPWIITLLKVTSGLSTGPIA